VPEVEVLEKTEIWLQGVDLDGADLPQLALLVADTLTLQPNLVFVVDVRDRRIVFDILQPRIELADVLGKEAELLEVLSRADGVTLLPEAAIHSRGVFGAIGVPKSDAADVLGELENIDHGLRNYVSSRVAIVSTGAEVVAGYIADTNVAVAAELMGAAGYEVTAAGAVADDESAILGRILSLVSGGFGVVLTTGGVGAEDKDRTIEAIQRADPNMATAILTTYAVDHGRHVKPSVRVGVGRVGWSRVIALPGPTPEVKEALPVVIEGLENGWSDRRLAEAIAAVLRDRWRGHRSTSETHQRHEQSQVAPLGGLDAFSSADTPPRLSPDGP
jgi:molybdenum cofactor synthesis domain-containing protein